MTHIDFDEITDQDITGKWRVYSRFLSKSDPLNIFATADEHSFLMDGTYKISNGSETLGKWNVQRNDDIIKRPYLSLELNSQKIQALITRLTASTDKTNAELTIYLSTGLELVLQKISKN